MANRDNEDGPGSTYEVGLSEDDDRPERDEQLAHNLSRGLVKDVNPTRPEVTAIETKTVEVNIVTTYKEARTQAIAAFERNFIRDLLECNDNNVTHSARSAGMDRVYLHRLMRRHGIR